MAPHVIETFELKGGSNQGCGCMHTWINVRTRLGSNLGAREGQVIKSSNSGSRDCQRESRGDTASAIHT